MIWNSTFKSPGKPLRRTGFKPAAAMQRPLARRREKRRPGLAQRVAMTVGTDIKHQRGESDLLRSEAHRLNVKALDCIVCGKRGPSDPAHTNATKGFGIKADDSLLFPACRACHRAHDQGGIYTQLQRWKKEWEYADATRSILIRKNQWPTHIEAAYQRAIVPLARVVHADVGVA